LDFRQFRRIEASKLSTTIRRWHSYIGLFIAPSVLFFALTGAVQIFSLHEKHGNYQPPAILEKLSSVHKDQVFAVHDHHGPPAPEALGDNAAAGAAAQPGAKDEDDELELSTLILKIFFLLVACSLALSTAFGLWMGLTQTRHQRLAWILVITGALVPLGLVLL
jgi:hypothetical protein